MVSSACERLPRTGGILIGFVGVVWVWAKIFVVAVGSVEVGKSAVIASAAWQSMRARCGDVVWIAALVKRRSQ